MLTHSGAPYHVEVETLTFVSGEAVPGDAPSNLRITECEHDLVSIRWDPPTVPNGRIVGYTVISDKQGEGYHDEEQLAADQLEYTREYTEPSTLYRFQVLARNSAGEGPTSTMLVATTEPSPLHRGKKPAEVASPLPPEKRRAQIRPKTPVTVGVLHGATRSPLR